MEDLFSRILRAAKLDVNLYEEVEADEGALTQATLVVVLSSLAAGVGGIFSYGFMAIIIGTISALIGWYVWAFLTYYIGTKLLPEEQTEADYGQLLRTLGFASSPGLIRVLGVIPGLLGIVNFIASVWMLVTMVIAVRQALDYTSTLRAVVVCVIGWIIQLLIIMLFYALFGFSITK
ncbi:MAG: YIP1 family protein [Calditrichia bacterium]|nr:YIP1 family protein [Calditrichia bacterium]